MRKATLISLCVALVALACALHAQTNEEEKGKVESTPLIQIGILLDTSGSMNGLIEQAKTHLWKIVNEFATAKKGGRVPDLQVALYQYGSGALPARQGYMRMVLPLTTDLDKVSEELFAFTTGGNEEYCGMVIKAAADGLKWSESDRDFKAIFIAGNEPFTQGNVHYRQACKAAIERGIVVNTIYCGSHQEGLCGKWQDGALLAEGKYMSIDQNQKVTYIAAPQDKEIARLGIKLNDTYIPFGARGEAGAANQGAQDSNAQSLSSGVNVERQVVKASSAIYRNSSWDLVDALNQKKVELEKVKKEDLPENMQKMTLRERKEYVQENERQRGKIQDDINKLNEQRKKHIAKKRKELAQSPEETLDSAIIKAVREQAAKKDFKLEESTNK